jgi:hypothetical protein
MTPLETRLAKALNQLTHSADWYIEDGSWIEVLTNDLKDAKLAIQEYKQEKKNAKHH